MGAGQIESRSMVDRGIPVRLVLYMVGLAYLMIDLFLIGGPVRRSLFRKRPDSPEVIATAKREGVAARVFFQPILLTQVDRRVEEELWKRGRSLKEVTARERNLLRRAAVNDLVDLHLLRVKVRYNMREYPVSDAEIDRELARFTKRFADEEEFRESLRVRGWSEKELRMRLAARLQQQKYLEGMIKVTVSEEEGRGWFEEHKEELAIPERIRARHIFAETLERKPSEAQRMLAEAKLRIERGAARFEELAGAISDDPRTKQSGGDLGWLQKGRLAPDFAESLFAMRPGRLELVRSKIGWHLVEVLERKAPRERSFEEAREEVMAALEAAKRDRGMRLYREQLRERESRRVEIFYDVLEREPETEAREPGTGEESR